jgi:hypothetical protein
MTTSSTLAELTAARVRGAENELDRRVQRVLRRRNLPASLRAGWAAGLIANHYRRWARFYES